MNENDKVFEFDDELEHYGMPRRSGRYPWGSGKDPYQRTGDFLSRVEELKKQGWTETPENIKKEFGISTTRYRLEKTYCNNERRMADYRSAVSMTQDGLGPSEIARRLGYPNESSIRSLLESKSADRMMTAKNTAKFLKERIKEIGMVDVTKGAELELGITRKKLDDALFILEKEGYPVYKGRLDQATNPGKKTTMAVLCPPGTAHKEIFNWENVHSLQDYSSKDGGDTFTKFMYPSSLDSKRLSICYKEDGGIEKDGTIELRRGVPDLSLGNARYSQVRILVDGTHYLKGMAVYADDLPDGVDVRFNTNKDKSHSKMEVLKPIHTEDPDNPFGTTIKPNGQSFYTDKDGKQKLSLINKRAEEGDWSDWNDTLPSQFLSKQPTKLAKKQLDLAKMNKQLEFEEIMNITNPTIKKHYLKEFADNCDKAAVELKAAALPGQKYHVIMPFPTMKDTEVYAPKYDDGTKLALIRYPHGGIFEIPILTVNNKFKLAAKALGKEEGDAIGINSKVAEQLSGADFDGDTVMCIPTHDRGNKIQIRNSKPLEELVGFDPKEKYKAGPNTRLMSEHQKQRQMGEVSNLITDMTLHGASNDELARAVKHSMVVIDAVKHKLDYKRSEIDNDIAALKKKYQIDRSPDGSGGANTIVSKAKGEASIPKTQGSGHINIKGSQWYDPSRPEGSMVYTPFNKLYYPVRTTDKKTGLTTYTTLSGKKITFNSKDPDAYKKYNAVEIKDANGGPSRFVSADGTHEYRVKKATQKTTKMAATDDAMSLVSLSRHPMELLYADYANAMKGMANKARIAYASTPRIKVSKEAKAKYAEEVAELKANLNKALLNAPREREAQRRTYASVKSKLEAAEVISAKDLKKIKQRDITAARADVGALKRKDRNITITDKQWEAIQSGAIAEDTLIKILANTDPDKLRERATPKPKSKVSKTQEAMIKAFSNSNYTISEIAERMNLSASTIEKYIRG